MKGHNYGGIICRKCGIIHTHPRGTLRKSFTFQRTAPAWNKGLTKETSPLVKYVADKISESFNKPERKKDIERIVEVGKKALERYHQEFPHYSENARIKMSESALKSWQNEDIREKRLRHIKNRKGKSLEEIFGQEIGEKIREALIKSGLQYKKSQLEKNMENIIAKHNLHFSYVGDGKIFIASKVPDFIHNNGKKLLIEVADEGEKMFRGWKSKEEYEVERRTVFGKYGFKTLFIWTKELGNESELVSKIRKWEEEC